MMRSFPPVDPSTSDTLHAVRRIEPDGATRMEEVKIHASQHLTLLEALRAQGRVSVKPACDSASCGSCAVLIEGRPAKSCAVLCASVGAAQIRTLEDFEAGDGRFEPLMAALSKKAVLQCGYCKSGFFFAAAALLNDVALPSESEVRTALAGILCRCTGYQMIIEAVLEAAQVMHARAVRAPVLVHRPATVEAALTLSEQRPGLRWLAGGQQLIHALDEGGARLEMAAIGHLQVLQGIRQQNDGTVVIGAASTHRDISQSPLLQSQFPELCRVAAQIGDVYVRERGTLGGAMASAARDSCYSSLLLAVDAVVCTPAREIPAAVWLRERALASEPVGELVLSIRLTPSSQVWHHSLRLHPGRLALVGVCASLSEDAGLRVGVAGYADRPFVMAESQCVLDAGEQTLSDTQWDTAVGAVPVGDRQASAAYRRAVLKHLLSLIRLDLFHHRR